MLSRKQENIMVLVQVAMLVICAICIMILFNGCCDRTIYQTQTFKDTTIVKIENKSFDFKDSLKIQYVNDSNIVTKPFIAYLQKIDSLRKDTVYIKYQFPQNKIEVRYLTKNDTTIKETIKEIHNVNTPIKDNEMSVWESMKLFGFFLSLALVCIGLYKFFINKG